MVCPHCTSTNAVSVFSLSLSRARTPVPSRHPGPSHARGPAEEDRPLRPCPLRRGHQHAARRSSLVAICLPHHRLLLPSPPGPQCSGRGEPQRLCLALGSRPRNATVTPGPQQILVAACTEDSGGLRGTSPAGPPRLHCIKLSRVPSSHHPSVSPIVFFPFPPSPPPAPSSLGSAQVNGSLPRLHGSPAHVTFPSRFFLCVYLSYFPSFLPFSFPSLPPSPAM